MEFKISSEDEEVLEETQGNPETRMDGVDSVEYGRMKQESAEEENTDAHKRFMEEEPLVIKQTDIPKRECGGAFGCIVSSVYEDKFICSRWIDTGSCTGSR